MMALDLIKPDWPAPAGVRAVSTTRLGGVSRAPFNDLNLGAHVGDQPDDVHANRACLLREARLPESPRWLSQVHSRCVVPADQVRDAPEADASWTRDTDVVCAVLTADCLPVLLCDDAGAVVAAAHGGWRGLVDGVLEATVRSMEVDVAHLMAWIGPGIGPSRFEVGDEVRLAFEGADRNCGGCFVATRPGHWLADLAGLAERRLRAAGVGRVFRDKACTYSEPERFFSYRRDGRTGRMASLIWRAL
jgi:YfiH family protein